MENVDSEVLKIFEDTKALLKGHFVLRSGLHSGHYFQCAQVGQHLDCVERLATLLLEKLRQFDFQTVLAPAMGGLVLGQEVARQAKARYIFAEKEDGKLVLRRGFKIAPGERILVVEDVITRGGRAQEAIDIVNEHGGTPVGLALLVDRSEGKAHFDVPWESLIRLSFPTYEPENLPPKLAAIPIEKPGS